MGFRYGAPLCSTSLLICTIHVPATKSTCGPGLYVRQKQAAVQPSIPLEFRTDNNGYFALLAPRILTPAESGKVNKWFRMARADHLSTHHGCSAIPPRTCKKSKGFVGTHEFYKQGLAPT